MPMTKWMKRWTFVGALLCAAPLTAQAEDLVTAEQFQRSMARQQAQAARVERLKGYRETFHERDERARTAQALSMLERETSSHHETPNLDPSAATVSAVLLLLGGGMVVLGHRQRHISR